MINIAAEKTFENKVKKFLHEKNCYILKYWGGGQFTKAGIPDLLVSCKGHFMGVELKAPKGRPSDLQIYHLNQIDKSGGLAVLLYPKDYELFQQLVEDPDNKTVYEELKSRWRKEKQ